MFDPYRECDNLPSRNVDDLIEDEDAFRIDSLEASPRLATFELLHSDRLEGGNIPRCIYLLKDDQTDENIDIFNPLSQRLTLARPRPGFFIGPRPERHEGKLDATDARQVRG